MGRPSASRSPDGEGTDEGPIVRSPRQPATGRSPFFEASLTSLPEPSEGGAIHEKEKRMTTETRTDYAGLNRKALQKHRDEHHHEAREAT